MSYHSNSRPSLQPSLLLLLLLMLQLAAHSISAARGLYPRPAYESPDYWPKEAREAMDRASRVRPRYNTAKNVILFIGDGMGISTVTAGRIFKGQLANSSGEEATLAFDAFDHAGLIRTYSADRQTPDSASTATAFLCGMKTNHYTLGVNQNAQLGSCTTYDSGQHDVESFLKMAIDQGKSAGVVTNTRITDATPASAYASSVNRRWEDDTDRDGDSSSPDSTEQRRACPDIANQLVHRGVNFTVLMGGGRLKFLPSNETTLDRVSNKNVSGTRSDGVNLVDKWRNLQNQLGRRGVYVESTEELMNLQPDSVDSLLGLMSTSNMEYHVDNIHSQGYKEPSLANMTRKSIEILSKNRNGFALLVEGGLVDKAHHDNRAQRALYDVVDLDEAVETAVKMTSPEDTLIVVSADHSHVFTFGYYGYRGQPVLGKHISTDQPLTYTKSTDGIEYTVVNYGDGPAATAGKPRANISRDTPEEKSKYRYQALIPRSSESHAGEDVSVHARGPGAHLFHSVHQQSYIAHVVMKSACLGWYADTGNCLRDPDATSSTAAPQATTTKTADGLSGSSTGSTLQVLVAAITGAIIRFSVTF